MKGLCPKRKLDLLPKVVDLCELSAIGAHTPWYDDQGPGPSGAMVGTDCHGDRVKRK